jgi:PEP-CTERM motif
MRLSRLSLAALLGIIASGVLALSARAQTPLPYNYSVTLSPTGPTFQRPEPGNPPTQLDSQFGFLYHAFAFQVDQDGTYSLETTAATLTDGVEGGINDDTFIALYQGVFDPENPLANLLEASDDISPTLLSKITRPLTAFNGYVLVTTTFSPESTGDIAARISGPSGSNLVTAAAPEPGSLALLGLGGVLTVVRRRRLVI